MQVYGFPCAIHLRPRLRHQPIVYIHRGVPLPELAALYARADCCLVTPLIDGMNLVVAQQQSANNHGESCPETCPGHLRH